MQINPAHIIARLIVGDRLLTALESIDDPAVAQTLDTHLWDGVDRVAAADLDREAVIDRLADARVISPDDAGIDVAHDVVADAYRVGYRDAQESRY